MCEYCEDLRSDLSENNSSDFDDGVTIELTCEDGQWEIVATGHFDSGYICGSKSVKVNYCPMCGRKLVGND